MNLNLIGSCIGCLLAIAAALPGDVAQQAARDLTPPASAVTRGNLTISTVPGNVWVMVTDYQYTPRIPPTLDFSGWAEGLPVQAVVRDKHNSCIGRITNETGQLTFIFVEADPPMCNGATPGARQELATGGQG